MWPANSAKQQWRDFEDDAVKTLQTILSGSPDKKMSILTTILYSMGQDRFGKAEKRQSKQDLPVTPSRRQSKITSLRSEIRQLTKQYRNATEEEKIGLSQLRNGLREKLKSLRRAENNKKNRKKWCMELIAHFEQCDIRTQAELNDPVRYRPIAPGTPRPSWGDDLRFPLGFPLA